MAFASGVLIVPSAAAYGGLMLMGWTMYVSVEGADLDSVSGQLQRWILGLSSTGVKATGSEAITLLVAIFFKIWLIISLGVLLARALLGIRRAPSFPGRVFGLFLFSALLWVVLAAVSYHVPMAAGARWTDFALIFGLVCGFACVFALPYLAVMTLIDSLIAKLS